MESSPRPNWLDEAFITQILESTKDQVKVVEFTCEEALLPGYSFCSRLYWVSVDYKSSQWDNTNTMSFIVKTPLESGEMGEFIQKLDFYNNEVKLYHKIFPLMHELGCLPVQPKSFFCPREQSLVLEDLRSEGYKTVDRLEQLDFLHCRLFLTVLARYHAGTVAAHHRDPQLIENAGKHWCFSDQESEPELDLSKRREMGKGMLLSMLDTMETLETCQQYMGIVRAKLSTYVSSMVKIVKPGKVFNVLCHGDSSIRNVMFKYKGNEPVDAKLLDFQMTFYSSFALDLNYFWWASTNDEVREQHQDQLFEFYRHTLNTTLHQLGVTESLSQEAFALEMNNCAIYALYVVCSTLHLILADTKGLMRPDDLLEEIKNQENSEEQRSEIYKTKLPKILHQIEQFGTFE